jgi:ribonuclease J
MNERRKIASHGLISVAIALDAKGRPVGSAELGILGVPVEEDRDAFLDEARDAATNAARKSKDLDEAKLREAVRLAVRRCATDWTGKKPVVDVLVVRT